MFGLLQRASATILLIVILVTPVWATSEPVEIMLVLDASGSMWGKVEGKTKIEIARHVIADLLDKTDANVQLGLTVYGHRQKSECNDIELLVPVGKASASEIVNIVNAINPKGKTPLSAAVKQAADAMQYDKKRATVILVSDGVETCDLDPCAVGAELAMSGTDFTTHVIGFDVKDKEQAGLKCLANNTGGLFLSAANTESLLRALTLTVEKAKEAPAEIVIDPGTASLNAPEVVQVGSEFEVVWQGPDSRGDYITIVEENSPAGSYKGYAYTKYGTPAKIIAPDKAGVYQLRYMFSHKNKIIGTRKIQVVDTSAALKFAKQQAAGSTFNISWTGPNNKGDYITVVPVGASIHQYMSYVYTSGKSSGELTAPDKPGEYEVRYHMNQTKRVLVAEKLTVTAVAATLLAPKSITIGSDFEVKWTGPNNKSDYVTIVAETAVDSAYASYFYTQHANPGRLTAAGLAGDYEVRYVQGQSKTVLHREKISVVSVNATLTIPSTVNVGESFSVKWQGPNNNRDYITLVAKSAADGQYGEYFYTAKSHNPSKLTAPKQAGEYEIRYVLGGPVVVIGRQSITVK